MDRREFLKLAGALTASYVGSRALPKRISTGLTPAGMKKNVLIFVFDALTSRQMNLYGYERSNTSFFNKLAQKALVYHNHYATGNFTVPGTASLLTGTLPWTHRGYHAFGTPLERFQQQNLFSLFNRTHHTIAASQNNLVTILLEEFRQHIEMIVPKPEISLSGRLLSNRIHRGNLVTLWGELVIRDSDNPLNSSLFFSLFDRQDFMKDLEARSKEYAQLYPYGIPITNGGYTYTLDYVFRKIENRLNIQPSPYFGYFHLWPPHEPYRPSAVQVGQYLDAKQLPTKPLHPLGTDLPPDVLSQLHDQYDEFIAYLDVEFEKFFYRLEASGALENTILILTSDHGQIFERGVHGHETPLLYESLLKIPLLVLTPGQYQRSDIYTPTSAVDILPTLASMNGLEIPEWTEGKILPGFTMEQSDGERNIIAIEAKENSKFANLTIGTVSVRKGSYKFIYYMGYENYSDRWELYNLDNDPEELDDISTISPGLVKDLRQIILDEISASNARFRQI